MSFCNKGKVVGTKDLQITRFLEDLQKNKNQVENDLEINDEILNGDLMRFYKNPDFKKVNPRDYNYKAGPKGKEN